MTREEIIRLAQESLWDMPLEWDESDGFLQRLERFAALVAAAERKRLEATAWGASKKWIVEAVAAERKACIEVCEEHWRNGGNAMECADSIRARGEK